MSKITKSARGDECELRFYPYCTGDPEQTVFCHLNSEDKGMGFKSPDWWGVYGCNSCHAVLDGRSQSVISREEINTLAIRALYRTQKKLIEKGLIEVK